MHNEHFDEELVQQMLDWLSRGVDPETNFPEVRSPGLIVLTDEDHYFLRQLKISDSLGPHLTSFAT